MRSLAAGNGEERGVWRLGHDPSWAPTSECDLDQAPLPLRALASSAVKWKGGTENVCGPIQICVHVNPENLRKGRSRFLGPGATFLVKLWAQFPQAEQWLALLLPGSATPDKPLSISVPWFTSPEKGNHSSDIVGFKSTVLLLVFYLSDLFLYTFSFFSAFFWNQYRLCFCFVFCVGLLVITLWFVLLVALGFTT